VISLIRAEAATGQSRPAAAISAIQMENRDTGWFLMIELLVSHDASFLIRPSRGGLLELSLTILLSTGDSIRRVGRNVHLLLPHAHHAACFV
jgi:hypothetical protein